MEDQIKNDLKEAMLKRDEIKVSTLRLLLSGLTYFRIQKGLKNTEEKLLDEEVVAFIQKELKKRLESADLFKKGARLDLAEKEEKEAVILQSYLPKQLNNEELTKVVEEAIKRIGANSIKDMGRVIGLVMSKVGPKTDGGRVAALVKEKLYS